MRSSITLLSPRLEIHRFSEGMMRNTHHLALVCFCGERHGVMLGVCRAWDENPERVRNCVAMQSAPTDKLLIPIAPSLYTLHEGRQVREEEIGGGKLLRALCDLGVKALEFWY
jgi:hypothetical protein